MAAEEPTIKEKEPMFLHYTRSLASFVLSNADAAFGSHLYQPAAAQKNLVIVVFHRDAASEELKANFKMLFAKADADLNFVFIEGGRVTCRTATPEFRKGHAIPKAFVNLFSTDMTCAVCFDPVQITREEAYMCKDCGTSMCHPCLTKVILSNGTDALRRDLHQTGCISVQCPVCRRLKHVLSDRWEVRRRDIVQDGVGVIDRVFQQLVGEMERVAGGAK